MVRSHRQCQNPGPPSYSTSSSNQSPNFDPCLLHGSQVSPLHSTPTNMASAKPPFLSHQDFYKESLFLFLLTNLLAPDRDCDIAQVCPHPQQHPQHLQGARPALITATSFCLPSWAPRLLGSSPANCSWNVCDLLLLALVTLSACVLNIGFIIIQV